MGNVCIFTPQVRGEQSKFYLELYEYTGKNRSLTNLLYAISVQDEIVQKFDSKTELNSQGEPKLKPFVDKLNVKQIIDSEHQILSDLKDNGFVDKNGEYIYFETIDDILDKVIEYNDNNQNKKATIQFVNQKFYVTIEQLNGENFGYNQSLKYNKIRFRHIIEHLDDLGFNVNFSDETKKFFNPINSGTIINVLYDLSEFDQALNPWSMINVQTISMMMDLFKDSPLLDRIKNEVGDEMSISEFIYIDSSEKRINEFISKIENQEEYDRIRDLLINLHDTTSRFIRHCINGLKNVDTGIIQGEIDDEVKNTTPEQLFEIPIVDLKYELSDLYNNFHIDQDIIESVDVKLDKLSQVANRLVNIAGNRLSFDKKTNSKTGIFNDIYPLYDKVRNGNYAQCCYNILQHVHTAILEYRASLANFSDDGKKNDLFTINETSKLIMKMIGVLNDYYDIVKTMMNSENLVNDGLDSTPELIKLISDTAKSTYSEMGLLKDDIEKRQFQNVYAFLRNYYSDEQNDRKPLETLMRLAEFDVGIFSRFCYSMHQCSDPLLAVLGQSVKEQHEYRDDILREINFNIRTITDRLQRSGSGFDFIFNFDENGNIYDIKSKYDYQAYYKDRDLYIQSLKDKGLKRHQIKKSVSAWDRDHRSISKEFGVDTFIPNVRKYPKYLKKDFQSGWTTEQIDYYNFMMNLKAQMIEKVGAASPELYSVVQLTDSMLGQVLNGKSLNTAWNAIKDKFKDSFQKRGDEIDYGAFDDSQLGIKNIDPNGRQIMQLPLFYTHEVKDKSRLTRDFSRAMMAYCATSVNYYTMNEIMDSLLLTKDFLENRKILKSSGQTLFGSLFKVGKNQNVQPEYITGKESTEGRMLDDYFDTIFGKKKNEWTGTLFGKTVHFDKMADSLIQTTSTLGLTVNFLGAEANVLVGKLQMLIESGMFFGGEFFNMKDMTVAEGLYWKNIPEILQECVSNNKKNKMALLGDEFDVSEDFYQDLAQTGFYKNPIGKILGNKSLMFLYGMGEHLLHMQGMLACLNNIKVVKVDSNGNEIEKGTLYDAFEVVTDSTGRNGKIVLKDGYKYLGRDGKIKGDVTKEYIAQIKKNVKYVNKTMHGAFGEDDRSSAKKYALFRMFMNFRQWMPEHYARRFRGRHYNAEIGMDREGYYVTVFNFVKDCIMGLKDNKYTIATRWNELDDMQKYNINRAISEVTMMAIMAALVFVLGLDGDDKKKNWAYRQMMYELKRVQMETKASVINPFNPAAFIDNVLNIMNQPFAQIKTIQSASSLVKFTDIAHTIDSGKYKGENKYLHNVKKNTPFLGQIRKQVMLEEGMFSIFD